MFKTFKTLRLGPELRTIDRPWVMGIINVTPDSFYAGSRTPFIEGVRARADEMAKSGVDVIDVGGYSTRPGAPEISADDEWDRLAPALETIRNFQPGIPVSVDTFRASIARKAVETFSIEIINDISGGDLDPDMFGTVAELKAAYVLMHTRGTPSTMQSLTDYRDVTSEVLEVLAHKDARLRELGVADVIIDPGFGFAKNVSQNYELLRNLESFKAIGRPILVGMSRKSMIWKPLDTAPSESLPGTIALHTAALMKGADMVRVHDVAAAVQMRDVISLLNP